MSGPNVVRVATSRLAGVAIVIVSVLVSGCAQGPTTAAASASAVIASPSSLASPTLSTSAVESTPAAVPVVVTPSPSPVAPVIDWTQAKPVLPAGRKMDNPMDYWPHTGFSDLGLIDGHLVAAGHDEWSGGLILTADTSLSAWSSVGADPGVAGAVGTPCHVAATAAALIVVSSGLCDPRLSVIPNDGQEYSGANGGASVWRTTDGTHFSKPRPIPGAASISALATDGQTFYAVGVVAHERTQNSNEMLVYRDLLGPFPESALWTSSDGIAWRQVTVPEPFERLVTRLMTGRTAGFTSVAAGPAGVLLVQDTRPIMCGPAYATLCLDPVALRLLPPGATTTRALVLRGSPAAVVTATVATSDGFLVAVVTGVSKGSARAEIWHVAADATWKRVYVSQPSGNVHAVVDAYGFGVVDLGGQEISRITVMENGYVGLGRQGKDALVVLSPDGTTWHPIPLAAKKAEVGMRATLLGIEQVDGRLVAVGSLIDLGATVSNPSWLPIQWIGAP